ncbi:MAG: SIMPL domain-containing protein [Gammaproteobacteria bacterium]
MQGKRYFCFAFFTCLLVTLTFPTFAADETLFNTVNLQASAEREIPNDEMIVLLATEHEGSETASLASKINSDMQWALELIKQYPTIQSQTRSYQTYPTYRKQVIIGWRASQQVEIKSKDISALTELVGKLQEKLQVKQMSFNPSKETRTNFENELIEEAMQAFLARVEIVKKHMPVKNQRIINLNINTGGFRPPVMHAQRGMMDSMKMAGGPAVEAGTSKLTVTVSGSVQYY